MSTKEHGGLLLQLTTEVAPAKQFTVDEEPYLLYGLNHLSKKDETEALALFARHAILVARLESSANVNKGKQLADEVKKCRLQILTRLTNLPQEIAEALPLGEQVKLFKAVQDEIGDDGDIEGLGSGSFDDGKVPEADADEHEADFIA